MTRKAALQKLKILKDNNKDLVNELMRIANSRSMPTWWTRSSRR